MSKNQSKNIYLAIFISIVLFTQTYSSCSGINSQDLIQSGIVSFNNLYQGQSCQEIPINYIIPSTGFQVVSSIQTVSGSNVYSNGLDYSIHSTSNQKSNSFMITFINKDCNWTSITISYFASSRTDLILGRFVTDVAETLGCCNKNNGASQNSANITEVIPNWRSDWNINKVIGFISGLKIRESSIPLVKISLTQINKNTGQIIVHLNSSQSVQIQLIHISYIIVLNNFPFSNDYQSNISDYSFSIVQSVQNNNFDNVNWSISTNKLICNDVKCSASCVSSSTCSALQGNSYNSQCLICKSNQSWNGSQCSANCGNNQIWNGQQCVCSNTSIIVNGQCVLCPSNSAPDSAQQNCLCSSNYIWSNSSNCCVSYSCPLNSNVIMNGNKTQCQCKSGYYQSSENSCDLIPSCPSGAIFSSSSNTCCCTATDTYLINNACTKCPAFSQWNGYKCACMDGYSNSGSGCVSICGSNQVWSNGKCNQQNTIYCPANSTWNKKKLTCQCINTNQYLINNACQSCGQYQSWNGQNCVCNSPYYLIQNQCQTCDIHSTYNGADCTCNQGYFGTRNNCTLCHSSCGTCTGCNSNNCLTCADVTYNLKNNICTRASSCPIGLYYNSNSSNCVACTTYCSNCSCDTDCSQCITGFSLQTLSYGGVKVSYCVQICGDGKRFQLQCDDGNTKSGDGCDSNCQVQSGWSCSGGSSVQASTCVSTLPNKSTVALTGTVLLLGKVVQGVKISYLPSQLTANDCPQCYQLLWVRVIRSDIVPGVSVSYLPKSQYQFLVQFDFHGTFSIPLFSISVQINPRFAKYFTASDLAQIQISTIDPSLLAINDQSTSLGYQDIAGNSSSISISTALIQKIFK